jgi:hypothetical protein
MSIPLAYQHNTADNEDSTAMAELAIAKAKIKMLQKQVNDLKQVKTEIDDLKTDVQGFLAVQMGMGRRMAVNEERQAYRQEMLFNGIKRIAEDVQHVKQHIQSQEADSKDDTESAPGAAKKVPRLSDSFDVKSPEPAKVVTRASENRKNFERALEHHVQEMNDAKTITEVQNSGKLAVKYSAELLKNFL